MSRYSLTRPQKSERIIFQSPVKTKKPATSRALSQKALRATKSKKKPQPLIINPKIGHYPSQVPMANIRTITLLKQPRTKESAWMAATQLNFDLARERKRKTIYNLDTKLDRCLYRPCSRYSYKADHRPRNTFKSAHTMTYGEEYPGLHYENHQNQLRVTIPIPN